MEFFFKLLALILEEMNSTPSVLVWLAEAYAAQPLATAVGLLLVFAAGLALLRKALKLFSIFLVLGAVALTISWVVRGEESTEQNLSEVVETVQDEIKERASSQD